MTTMTAPVSAPAPAVTGNGLTRALHDIATMTKREIVRTLRSVDGLITALVLPLFIMLVFVVIFGGALESEGPYIEYVVPGALILTAGFGSTATAITVAQDMTSGTIARFRTLPIFAPSVLIGHVTASVLRNLVASTLVVAVALGLGFRTDATFGGWLAAAGILVLAILAFTWVSVVAGLLLSVDAANAMTFVFLFLPYVSTGFVPVSTMPNWLQGFARHQPFSPIIETLRGFMTGTSVETSLWPALAWLVGILVVGYAAATVIHRQRSAR